MPDLNLQTLDPVTGAAPKTRIKDASSLNAVVKKLIESDGPSALARHDVQEMVDGAPPYNPEYMVNTGQEGRCNLNFGDGKAQVKAEMAGYYDLTESVPTLALVLTDYGTDASERANYSGIISEEWHRMLKGWKSFNTRFQLLIQKMVTHGVGFVYFKDEVDWRWEVAGQEDFKVPRQVTVDEDEVDIAICLREVTVGKLYKWIDNVTKDDTRWNLQEVRTAIMKASDSNLVYSDGQWEKYDSLVKNNDLWASSTAQDTVKIVHAWIREFDGTVSQYITLRDGSNTDYLFKCQNRFDDTGQCFTFFPYEVGTNGTLHSVRGKGHEVYACVQVLNTLRCQSVDNARFAGSLLIQPKTAQSAEDLAILFFNGAAYLPPNVEIKNNTLGNPSQGMLPIIRDMSLTMRQNSGDYLSKDTDQSNEKTKFQVQSELMKEAVLPTASLDLFYQPWGRLLNEVWRRTKADGITEKDPGGKEILEFRKRCKARNVPDEAIKGADLVIPMRAVGYGSPSNRLLALDEFLQYYGNLDPVGQNNLLRARFAQKVGYAQVDQFVPKLDANGRGPVDIEIAELQNTAMSTGKPLTVRPNDAHIIHLQSHIPDLSNNELDSLESGQGDESTLKAAQVKIDHIAQHMKYQKSDKLNQKLVAELTRQFNNVAERVQAAIEHFQRRQAKEALAQQAAQAQGPAQPPQVVAKMQEHSAKMQMDEESHQQRMRIAQEDADQRRALEDAKAAAKMRADTLRERVKAMGGQAGRPAGATTPSLIPPGPVVPPPAVPPASPLVTATP